MCLFSVHIAYFAKQTFSIQNKSHSSYLRSIKLVSDLDKVKNLSWAVMSYCFVVFVDFQTKTYSMEQNHFFKNY